jgi:NAD(P)-dependent dehydrogenase (short-subunit alcohol dehydrogenase family)
MESLHAEVGPFGITTTIVNPGFFRTELLTEQSTNYAKPSVADYDERSAQQLEFWKPRMDGNPATRAKLARALITIASQEATAAPLHRRLPTPLPPRSRRSPI